MPRVRIGIIILPDLRWQHAMRRWRLAEEYGFAHAWTYDHLGWRDLVDGPWFDAVPTLTAAAMVTSRIPLGTMVASPNFRHPVSFARQLTALDDVSNGRLMLGVGAEFTELLDLLLRTDRVTWRGDYYAAVDARSAPGCVQLPRVPFVVAANGPRTRKIAARFGQGWVTTGTKTDDLEQWWRSVTEAADRFAEALDAAGRDPGSVHRYLSLDAGPVFSLSSAAYFADAVGRAAEAGFTDVTTHWPRPAGSYAGDESVLEAVAADVLPRWHAQPSVG